jgi:predicted nucleic acid-binding protein
VTTFLDTSFLIKLYIPEIHSDKAVAIASQLSGSVAVSALTDVEMASALFRRLPGAQAQGIYDKYRRNRGSGLFQEFPVNDMIYLSARTLAERHAAAFLLRSIDILHLATALHHGATGMATFDDKLAKAAAALGLQVFP